MSVHPIRDFGNHRYQSAIGEDGGSNANPLLPPFGCIVEEEPLEDRADSNSPNCSFDWMVPDFCLGLGHQCICCHALDPFYNL